MTKWSIDTALCVERTHEALAFRREESFPTFHHAGQAWITEILRETTLFYAVQVLI